QLLLDAANAISKSLSMNGVLSNCSQYMQKATGAKDIRIHLYNEKDGTLYPFQLSSVHVTEDDWRDKHEHEINVSIHKDRLFYEVITGQKAIAIPDVFADPRPNHHAC